MKRIMVALYIANAVWSVSLFIYSRKLKTYKKRLESDAKTLVAGYETLKSDYKRYVIGMAEMYGKLAGQESNHWNSYDDFFLNKWSGWR